MLDVVDLRAWYGPVQALRGVSLAVPKGRVLAVVGPNGAGKTTLARAVAGLHRERAGAVRSGGVDLSTSPAVDVARAGVRLVPQGRRLFASLTVAEHLTLAQRHRRSRAMSRDRLLELFPSLDHRMDVRARSLSGGEQQMLAIARAVLPGPDVLVLDEPTEGLAPAVVSLVARLIAELRDDGVGLLLLEQEGRFPFDVADDVVAIDRGLLQGPAERPHEIRTREEVRP